MLLKAMTISKQVCKSWREFIVVQLSNLEAIHSVSHSGYGIYLLRLKILVCKSNNDNNCNCNWNYSSWEPRKWAIFLIRVFLLLLLLPLWQNSIDLKSREWKQTSKKKEPQGITIAIANEFACEFPAIPTKHSAAQLLIAAYIFRTTQANRKQ